MVNILFSTAALSNFLASHPVTGLRAKVSSSCSRPQIPAHTSTSVPMPYRWAHASSQPQSVPHTPHTKEKLIKATDISTIVTGKSLGHPVRSLKTLFSRNFAKMENDPNITSEEILAFGGGALRKAVKKGDANGSYMAGESAGMVKNIEPAAEIVKDIILGAEKVITETAGRLR